MRLKTEDKSKPKKKKIGLKTKESLNVKKRKSYFWNQKSSEKRNSDKNSNFNKNCQR